MQERLKIYLEKHNYDEFKKEIDKLNVTEDNYESYLNMINDVIIKQMMSEPFGGEKSSETRLVNAFNDKKEETFFDVVSELRKYVKEVFLKKLNIKNYVDDSPIIKDLESFESRFM
mgnify:CR=1 FL=1